MNLGEYVLFGGIVVIAWASVEIYLLLGMIQELREWLSYLDEEVLENTEDIDNIYRVMAERDRRTK